jgi:hypothetical protein
MHDHELFEDARASKQALIGGPICGFIPPFNRLRISRKKEPSASRNSLRCRGGEEAGRASPRYSTLGGAVPRHATGFDETSSALVRRFLDTDALIALYAHPNQALDPTLPNDESAA